MNTSRLTELVDYAPDSLGAGAKSSFGALFTERDRERFWAKVARGADDACWPWTGSRYPKGYGQFTVTVQGATGKQLHKYAHRIAWILTRGEIPAALHALHRCDSPSCCNPSHLFLGTHLDNMRDAARKGRLSVPRPGRHKVTTEQLAEIDALLAAGETQAVIARRFGVTKGWVCGYVRGNRRQYDRPRLQKTKVA